MLKFIKQLFISIKNWFKAIIRRRLFSKVNKALQEVYLQQLEERKILNKKIRKFLHEYFGLDARSKFIPAEFKNREEVRFAIEVKFEQEMKALNVKFEDIFPT